MRFDVLTIFPALFSHYPREGVLGKALEKGLIEIHAVNIRDFTLDPHRTTDDRPYGGGEGMVMKPEPIINALESLERLERSTVVLLTPQGEKFDQAMARELAGLEQMILVCGRYEGIDERVRALCIEREISIGDYVLSGGELAALVVIDAVSRLVPGVLGGERSTEEESFSDGLLEYPHYTRPREFRGLRVPEVLLSGDHARIRRWRRAESLKRTLKRRPDLLEKADLSPEDKVLLEQLRDQMQEST